MSGRIKCLHTLDKMLARDGNQALLYRKMQNQFWINPVRFFQRFVAPLLPKMSQTEGTLYLGTTPITPDKVALMMDELTVGKPVKATRVRLNKKRGAGNAG